MTKVKAKCTCAKCGREFEMTSAAFNSRQAAEKKEWMESQEYWLCPECYKAQKKAELEEKIKKYNLPELEGTEKQIKYASDLRGRFVQGHEKQLDEIMAFEKAANKSENIEMAKQQLKVDEITPDEIVEKLISQSLFSEYLTQARIVLNETKAGKVIEALSYRR